MELGTTDSELRQRLLSFCDRILRGYQHAPSAYLSLRALCIPPNVDCTRAIQTVRPALGRSCTWVTGLVETDRRASEVQGPAHRAVWSLCGKFITVGLHRIVQILDAVTLERLHTSESSRTAWLGFSPDGRSLMHSGSDPHGFTIRILHTGGQVSATYPAQETLSSWYPPSTYSMDGNMIGVAYGGTGNYTVISTYNLPSGTHTYSHYVSEGLTSAQIWTRDESLRFATVERLWNAQILKRPLKRGG